MLAVTLFKPQPFHTVILSAAKDVDVGCYSLFKPQPLHTVILSAAKDLDVCIYNNER
jgi:hypothetical protein